ncbi:MAG: PorT family protein [Ferruginibacter sp.]|nr:PorT family protein [Ferruginibacter sp.]
MKAKLLTLVVFVLIFSAANAQSFHLGIKGGANINKLTGKSFKDEFSFGYHLGGFAEIGLSEKFSVQPEVVFNEFKQDTSSHFRDIYQLNNLSTNIKLNYLSIPILLNYKPSSILSLQLGPQFGILMNQNEKLLQNGKDAFKKGDFSMVGGVQLKFSSIRVYGRYALGLSNLNDIDKQDKWKSQSFQLGVGLAIL